MYRPHKVMGAVCHHHQRRGSLHVHEYIYTCIHICTYLCLPQIFRGAIVHHQQGLSLLINIRMRICSYIDMPRSFRGAIFHYQQRRGPLHIHRYMYTYCSYIDMPRNFRGAIYYSQQRRGPLHIRKYMYICIRI